MRLIFVLKVCGKPLPALKAAAGTRGRRGSWKSSIASESVVRTAQAGCDAKSLVPLIAKVPCGGGVTSKKVQLGCCVSALGRPNSHAVGGTATAVPKEYEGSMRSWDRLLGCIRYSSLCIGLRGGGNRSVGCSSVPKIPLFQRSFFFRLRVGSLPSPIFKVVARSVPARREDSVGHIVRSTVPNPSGFARSLLGLRLDRVQIQDSSGALLEMQLDLVYVQDSLRVFLAMRLGYV